MQILVRESPDTIKKISAGGSLATAGWFGGLHDRCLLWISGRLRTKGLVIALAVFQPHAPGEASSTSSVSGFPYQVIC